jgi:hypothetical protein
METPEKFVLQQAFPRFFLGQNIPLVFYYKGLVKPCHRSKLSDDWGKDPNQALEMTKEEIKVVLSHTPTGVMDYYSKVLKADAIAAWKPDDWRNETVLTLDGLKDSRLKKGNQ